MQSVYHLQYKCPHLATQVLRYSNCNCRLKCFAAAAYWTPDPVNEALNAH